LILIVYISSKELELQTRQRPPSPPLRFLLNASELEAWRRRTWRRQKSTTPAISATADHTLRIPATVSNTFRVPATADHTCRVPATADHTCRVPATADHNSM
jgi:hypothetical protein